MKIYKNMHIQKFIIRLFYVNYYTVMKNEVNTNKLFYYVNN
jgi:hypothetical protein